MFGGHKIQMVDARPTSGFYFEFVTETCELRLHRGGSKDRGLCVDFQEERAAYRLQKLSLRKDLLARAVGVEDGLKLCDLTLGLAQDAYKMAYLGAKVTGVERHPVVAALVKNAIERGKDLPELQGFQLVYGEAKYVVDQHGGEFEVFYLDPMYSHKRKALPKKEMQYLSELVDAGSDDDYRPLIESLQSARRKLVVKRPRQDGPLCGIPPKRVVEGKMVRFDVYG